MFFQFAKLASGNGQRFVSKDIDHSAPRKQEFAADYTGHEDTPTTPASLTMHIARPFLRCLPPVPGQF